MFPTKSLALVPLFLFSIGCGKKAKTGGGTVTLASPHGVRPGIAGGAVPSTAGPPCSCGSSAANGGATGTIRLGGPPLPSQTLQILSVEPPHFDFGRELGRGSFGVVRICTQKSTGRKLACKTFHQNIPEAYTAEKAPLVKFYKKLVNIRKFLALPVAYDDKNQIIVYELAGGQSGNDVLKNGCPLEMARAISLSTLEGVKAFHLQGLRHNDVKSENLHVLENGAVQFFDLGVMTSLYNERPTDGGVYKHPLRKSPFNDLFSAAYFIAELFNCVDLVEAMNIKFKVARNLRKELSMAEEIKEGQILRPGEKVDLKRLKEKIKETPKNPKEFVESLAAETLFADPKRTDPVKMADKYLKILRKLKKLN